MTGTFKMWCWCQIEYFTYSQWHRISTQNRMSLHRMAQKKKQVSGTSVGRNAVLITEVGEE